MHVRIGDLLQVLHRDDYGSDSHHPSDLILPSSPPMVILSLLS